MLLRASRNRVLQLIGAVAAVMAVITIAAVARFASGIGETSNLIKWGVGCALFALFATLWYRARVKAIAELTTAVANGWTLHRCQITAVFVKRIPLGHEVDLVAVDATRTTTVSLAFGFWTRASASRLVDLLQPNIVPGSPPAVPLKMRAPNVKRT